MSRVEFAAAAYRILLKALPPHFRERNEKEMMAWFRDHSAARPGSTARPGFWLMILKDLARTLTVEWWTTLTMALRNNPRKGEGGGMDGLLHDARVSIRSFCRRPGLLLLILSTLGIGVGAATTVYSVVHGVLLAPLPYEEPGRIVRVGKISEGRAGVLAVSALDLDDLQDRNRSFTELAASRPANMTLSGAGEPELIRVAMVSSQFFGALGRHPAMGRAWGPAADEPNGAPVIVLSDGIWQRRWGGDPQVLGRTIMLSGTSFTIIGIMPRAFVPPEALSQRGTEAWIPLASLDAVERSQRGSGFLQLIGRLRPEVNLESANTELAALGAELSRDYPEPGERTFGLSPLHDETVGDAGSSLLPLLAAVGLLLAIGCINVANLLLMRASERAHQTALRSCLGAGRGRLIRQVMTEGLLLGLAGGLLGALVAVAGVKAFAAFGPAQLPRLAEITVSAHLLVSAIVISVLTGVLFSIIPSFRGSKASLASRLAGGGRGRSGSRTEARLRDALVVAESAFSIVLVICGGLLLNSLLRLNTVDTGFHPEGVAVISLSYPEGESPEQVGRFFDDMMDGIARIPGVRAVGATVNLPLSGNRRMLRFNAPGLTLSEDDAERGGYPVNYQQVAGSYFETMGVALRNGRTFARSDDGSGPRVAIVNESLAQRLVPNGDVVGSRMTLSDDSVAQPPITIVGVVSDTRQQRLEAVGEPELYFPFHQRVTGRMEIVARGAGPGASLLPAMREQVWAARPDLPIRRSVDMTHFVAQSVADRRFVAWVVTGFAVLALALTIVGVYGTLAYAVSQRRRELGVRLAMGAPRAAILRAVLFRSTRTVAVGIALGVGAALVATRFLESQLFGVTSTDPLTVGTAIAVVLVAATAASLVPARRAASVDPMVSLRLE